MIHFDPCPACARHVKRVDPRCPFCGAAIPPANTPITRVVTTHLSRAAQLALAAGVVLACSSDVHPLYGAPFDAGWPTTDGGDASDDASASCFSPTQNLDTAYAGGVGCPCAGSEPDQCRADSSGRMVALTCAFGQRHALEDGACGP